MSKMLIILQWKIHTNNNRKEDESNKLCILRLDGIDVIEAIIPLPDAPLPALLFSY